ncbi:DUF4345 domain-containing protein [Mycobacterium asiaticum]|uniref:DUF4345 domain-containing protein n=1 Tax=Mycobacterium asiaticum TaxID=1790 RepID=UPI0007F00A70|nr:DUF4345 domain-containing protein [Mycobacterium asiaticum]OBK92115.1 DUF4345 domain-containing protein [Mycobacterium asiaticum]
MTLTVLVVTAAFFLGMGVYALAAPARMIGVFGIALPERTSRSEVRAVYGGFGCAIAGVLAFAAVDSSSRSGIMLTVGLALGGMAVGRLVSAAIEGRTPFYPNWFYFLVETVAATALLLTSS